MIALGKLQAYHQNIFLRLRQEKFCHAKDLWTNLCPLRGVFGVAAWQSRSEQTVPSACHTVWTFICHCRVCWRFWEELGHETNWIQCGGNCEVSIAIAQLENRSHPRGHPSQIDSFRSFLPSTGRISWTHSEEIVSCCWCKTPLHSLSVYLTNGAKTASFALPLKSTNLWHVFMTATRHQHLTNSIKSASTRKMVFW